jgi:hypothetical protein
MQDLCDYFWKKWQEMAFVHNYTEYCWHLAVGICQGLLCYRYGRFTTALSIDKKMGG